MSRAYNNGFSSIYSCLYYSSMLKNICSLDPKKAGSCEVVYEVIYRYLCYIEQRVKLREMLNKKNRNVLP